MSCIYIFNNKIYKKKIKKISGGGTSLHKGLEPTSEITEIEPLKIDKNEGRLINVPVDVLLDEGILEKGFYNIYGEKEKDGTIYISFKLYRKITAGKSYGQRQGVRRAA